MRFDYLINFYKFFRNVLPTKESFKQEEIFEGPTGLVHGDDDVLVEGLKQAKLLTNSIEILNGLPETIQNKVPTQTSREIVALLNRYHFLFFFSIKWCFLNPHSCIDGIASKTIG